MAQELALRFDVLTIGNAIVDIIAPTEEDILLKLGVTKGMMRLIEADEAARIYDMIGPAVETSGGSAGNTAAGVASFGGRAAYIGKVATDAFGDIFSHDMRAQGVHYATKPLAGGAPTARSVILVTPDSERTMNTYLGACHQLTEADIDESVVGAAAHTYLEGFLWDPPAAKLAFRKAAAIAHAHGRSVSITLSDSFCVDRFRPEFLDLMRTGTVDMVLANKEEAKALYETADLETAVAGLRRDCKAGAVTLGGDGAVAFSGDEVVAVPAVPVDELTDMTGAGDQFAAGFLYGLSHGLTLGVAARLGCLAGGECVGHIGPRPARPLAQLARDAGLLS
jgi:sugar/nucleoside kinase (ribokinase family)